MENNDDFVTAHMRWRSELSKKIKMHSIDVESISRDDLCDIGKWIYGDGIALHKELPEFLTLKEAHAKFHRAVATSLSKTGSIGSDDEFIILIKAQKKFSDAVRLEERIERCSKLQEGIKQHLNQNSLELAKVISRTRPCNKCKISDTCTIRNDMQNQFTKIRKIMSVRSPAIE